MVVCARACCQNNNTHLDLDVLSIVLFEVCAFVGVDEVGGGCVLWRRRGDGRRALDAAPAPPPFSLYLPFFTIDVHARHVGVDLVLFVV